MTDANTDVTRIMDAVKHHANNTSEKALLYGIAVKVGVLNFIYTGRT